MSQEMYAVEALATIEAARLYRGDKHDPKMLFHCAEAVQCLLLSFEKRHRSPAPQTEEERNRRLHEIGMCILGASHALGLHTGTPHTWSQEELQKHLDAFDPDDPGWKDNYGFEL